MSTPRPALGPRYWRLWTASTASNLADGVVRIGLPLLAVQLTRSPGLVGGLTVALWLPWLLMTLPAGAIADRSDRRRLMIASALGRAAVLTVLGALVVAGQAALAWLYVAALLLGTAETIFDTTSQSILPDIVDRQDLSRANSRLYAAQLVMNEFAGAPLAGALVSLGAVAALATPAALYGLTAAGLLFVAGSFRPATASTFRLDRDIVEGVRYLWRHPLLRRLALLVAVSNLSYSAAWSMVVLYVVEPGPVGLNGFGFGVLVSMLALGSVAGSLVVEALQRWTGRAKLLLLGMLGNVLVVGTPFVTEDAFWIGAAFLVGGATNMWWNVITVSLRQSIVPGHLLGRVNASYRMLAAGALPLGAALGGLVGELATVRAVFGFAAVLGLALLPALRGVTDAAIHRAEATP
jgi:MFS family permease